MTKEKCGVEKKNGEHCQLPAGWGTDHVGEGACKLHGGAASKNVKHGLYSKYTTHRLADMIDKLADDEELLDLRQTVATQQALILDMLNRLEKGDLKFDSDLAGTMSNISDKLGRNIERLHKVEEGEKYILQVEEVQKVVEQVVIIIREEVRDSATVQRIGKRLQEEVRW